MTMRFYDSASATIREFEPVVPGEARIYYCGATVQGEPHLGHIRSALVFDQLSRWMRYRGLKVTTVRNVTDIDDKILAKSADSMQPGFEGEFPNEQWWALAYRFEKVFARAYAALGIDPPTYEPRATGHIPEMFALIQRLIDRGHAYPALDDSGDVYFDVRSWEKYGSLTNQSIDDMQDSADADPRGKRDPRDFALWKGYKEGEPLTASWESPWGRGRPGWHLECSAMAGKYLGSRFDIHGGGLDLRFPHHENELAQSTAAGDDFANFWMHNGMVTYEGEKMSKSIGNTISPAQMLEMARPLVVRYYLGSAHYRSVLDYRPSSLQEAATAIERVESFLAATQDLLKPDREVPEAFAEAMDDDMNIPRALAVLHEQTRAGNAALAAGEDASEAANAVMAMAEVLGLAQLMSFNAEGASDAEHEALDSLIQAVLAERADARAQKDWAKADAMRDLLFSAGVKVRDGAEGSSWSIA
ncbi:MAG: cysteine--tRNA ligase [Rothia mucilaginosa]|uniref:cysteine--tRNA ligase n=1 Tax=Rothia TaxID=32207 RepID=UPI00066C51DE|nr:MULTISPECIES: cysteine--tRNA ligase [Rothia]MBF1676499.1 cysteine--tRNA ligase [Rothia sp. (in: high G+C Gram-positive bacteria)]MDU6366663.1 cysteine--tRNA ligase [Rothia mucilaginosa]OFM99923.1 cysteine--tRNA ligase [Rothia sp. HMSC072B03]OFQ28627.1 cysteine--tRNA ligase [Rothia sp. HMSC072E10]OFR67170.1 cysteine--tRNA ligase [Rothia sp. HMSC068F09]